MDQYLGYSATNNNLGPLSVDVVISYHCAACLIY